MTWNRGTKLAVFKTVQNIEGHELIYPQQIWLLGPKPRQIDPHVFSWGSLKSTCLVFFLSWKGLITIAFIFKYQLRMTWSRSLYNLSKGTFDISNRQHIELQILSFIKHIFDSPWHCLRSFTKKSFAQSLHVSPEVSLVSHSSQSDTWQAAKRHCDLLQWCHMSTIRFKSPGDWLFVKNLVQADKDIIKASRYLPIVRGIYWWRVDSLHNTPGTKKAFPYLDVIMLTLCT